MDIIIKSFNRAYYLDRCLFSIFLFVKNFNGKIFILDDGTPQVYLDKIKLKYPDVIIVKSDNYKQKSKLIESQNYELPEIIPSKLWYEVAKIASDYFIVLEDDIWFTKQIDIERLRGYCEKENLALLKLFWVSNKKVIGHNVIKQNDDFVIYKTGIKIKQPIIYKYLYTKHNIIWQKLLRIHGLVSTTQALKYYTIYSVAGAIFKKSYFLSIWKNSANKVNEKEQIKNALKYVKDNKVYFGRTNTEVLKTGFMSSASSKYNYSKFSIHNFNYVLNNFWLSNDSFFSTNLESDLDENKIKDILKSNDKSDTYINQWQDWVGNFKQEFRVIGCDI